LGFFSPILLRNSLHRDDSSKGIGDRLLTRKVGLPSRVSPPSLAFLERRSLFNDLAVFICLPLSCFCALFLLYLMMLRSYKRPLPFPPFIPAFLSFHECVSQSLTVLLFPRLEQSDFSGRLHRPFFFRCHGFFPSPPFRTQQIPFPSNIIASNERLLVIKPMSLECSLTYAVAFLFVLLFYFFGKVPPESINRK